MHETHAAHVLAVVDQQQLQSLLAKLMDPDEFLSPHGMRSLSKYHQQHPYSFGNASVGYEPAESIGKLKGGNSNWRGPVWFPTSFLMIEALRKLEKAFGGSVRVSVGEDIEHDHTGEHPRNDPETGLADTRVDEGMGAVGDAIVDPVPDARARGMTMPTPSTATPPGHTITLTGVASRLADRMIKLFDRDADGYRPIHGPRGTRRAELFAHDPHWKDLLLFYEYFHGDHGEGLGASHQTGWTGLVASLIDEWRA